MAVDEIISNTNVLWMVKLLKSHHEVTLMCVYSLCSFAFKSKNGSVFHTRLHFDLLL